MCSKLEDVDIWMAERHLPKALQKKVLGYYVDVWAQQTGGGLGGGLAGWLVGGWVQGRMACDLPALRWLCPVARSPVANWSTGAV